MKYAQGLSLCTLVASLAGAGCSASPGEESRSEGSAAATINSNLAAAKKSFQAKDYLAMTLSLKKALASTSPGSKLTHDALALLDKA